MQKQFSIKAFLSFFVLLFSFFPVRLESITCQLCKKFQAHPASFQKEHPNYFWTQPLSENESTDGHQLCQCCASLAIAQNYDFVSEFFHEKCPLCTQESRCPVRVDPFKICVINLFGNPEGRTMSLIGSQLKILVIDKSTIFSSLLPIIFKTCTETTSQLILPIKTKKELFFGIICKEQIDSKTQCKALFGNSESNKDIQGFYNSVIIIIDPSGKPISYASKEKPETIDSHRFHFTHFFYSDPNQISFQQITYFLSNPLD